MYRTFCRFAVTDGNNVKKAGQIRAGILYSMVSSRCIVDTDLLCVIVVPLCSHTGTRRQMALYITQRVTDTSFMVLVELNHPEIMTMMDSDMTHPQSFEPRNLSQTNAQIFLETYHRKWK